MPVRRLIVLVVVLLACSAVASVLIVRSASRAQRGTGGSAAIPVTRAEGGAFAYATERQLVVMRGHRVIARLRRIFGGPDQDKVVWTNDGNYVALLKGAPGLQEAPSQEQLITVNVRTGAVIYRACPACYDLTPVYGDGFITVSDPASPSGPLTFKIYDVASDGPPRRSSLGLVVNPVGYVTLPASTRTRVLIAQSADGDRVMDLKLADPTGAWHSNLGSYWSSAYMPVAVGVNMPVAIAENSSESGSQIAVAFSPGPGGCLSQFPIAVFNSDGISFNSDMATAFPPGHTPGVDEGLQVNDLWFGLDGHFYATITSWTCGNPTRSGDEVDANEQLYSSSRVWRLDGQAWSEDASQAATMMRQISNTERIVLVIPSCIGPHAPTSFIACETGTLYSDTGQATTILARHVISISAPAPNVYAQAVLGHAIASGSPITVGDCVVTKLRLTAGLVLRKVPCSWEANSSYYAVQKIVSAQNGAHGQCGHGLTTMQDGPARKTYCLMTVSLGGGG